MLYDKLHDKPRPLRHRLDAPVKLGGVRGCSLPLFSAVLAP